MAAHYDGCQRVICTFPPQHRAPFPPEQAAEMLLSLNSLNPERLRYGPYPHKPPVGSLFVFQKNPDEPFPIDGYGWMGSYVEFRVSVHKRELEILHCAQGFNYGDRVATLQKHSYRFRNTNLYLIHYTACPEQKVVPVQPHLIKVHPAPSGQPLPQHSMEQPGIRHISGEKYERGAGMCSTNEASVNPSVIPVKEVTERQKTIARYKRNHEFMDLIFSVNHTNAFLSVPEIPGLEEQVAALKTQTEAIEKEIPELKIKQEEYLRLHTAIFSHISKHMHQINDARSETDLDKIHMNLETSLKKLA